jgi:hypothetical protein
MATPAGDNDKPPRLLIDARITALEDWRGVMLSRLRGDRPVSELVAAADHRPGCTSSRP